MPGPRMAFRQAQTKSAARARNHAEGALSLSGAFTRTRQRPWKSRDTGNGNL